MELWALIDANNFFVSCERVFRPDLQNKPVIVLSCNDGCTVSRSKEAKDLGIPMGAPRFQIADKIAKYDVKCFSSNFRLYGDLSNRLMSLIRDEVDACDQEIYSVDECFVRLTRLPATNWQHWTLKLRTKIIQSLGIPVTIGIAPSKTLAKLAVEIAKNDFLSNGTMVWLPDDIGWHDQYLRLAPINSVWGLGQASVHQLLSLKIDTVQKFMELESAYVRKLLGLGGQRTWSELHGTSCIEFTQAATHHRQILRSRSFAEAIYQKSELEHALATFLTIGVDNLRRHHWRASFVTTCIRTSHFVDLPKRRAASQTISLEQSSSYLPDLAAAMKQGLERIFQPGYPYKKAAIILSGIEAENAWQPQLLPTDKLDIPENKKQALMQAVDKINRGYGAHKIGIGLINEGPSRGHQVNAKWHSRSTMRSPEYSTSWEQLRLVH